MERKGQCQGPQNQPKQANKRHKHTQTAVCLAVGVHLSRSRTPGYGDLTRPSKWACVFNTLDEGAVNVGTEGIDTVL